jgi:hypothetical protein
MIDYKNLREKSNKISKRYPMDMPESVEAEFIKINKQLNDHSRELKKELIKPKVVRNLKLYIRNG